MDKTVEVLDVHNWEPWAESLMDYCFSRSVLEQLALFFRYLLARVDETAQAGQFDLSDRSALKIYSTLESAVFTLRTGYDYGRISWMLGLKFTIEVKDPKGQTVEFHCYIKRDRLGFFRRIYLTRNVIAWADHVKMGVAA